MKRYIAKAAVLLVSLVLPFGLFFAGVQGVPAQFGGSIMSTLPHKINLAQTTAGPRILLAGGSASPYSTNCALLSELMGRSCINVGVTAYLGIDYYLSLLENSMRPGDIIVLAPEFSMLAGAVDYQTVWMSVENNADALRLVPASYWPGMFSAYGAYAEEKLEHSREAGGAPPPLYHGDFGPLGDVTARREPFMKLGFNAEDPNALEAATLDSSVVKRINRFARKAGRQGVTVVFAFAPVNRMAVITPPEDWDALDERIRREIQLPVLGSQRDAVMAPELFYDSNSHLNTAGATLYSTRLAELLREYLSGEADGPSATSPPG